MEAIKLNDQQRLYLQTIFDHFHEHGKWPTYSNLDRVFSQLHPNLDIDKIAKGLPPGLSKPFNAYMFDVHGYANEDAFLTVPAIYRCQGSQEDLTDFVRAIRFCVERYNSSDKEKRQVSSNDLLTLLNLSELSTRKIGLLLQVEPWIFTAFSTRDDGSWQCTLSRETHRYRNVQTIEQYLEKREMLKSHISSPATEPTQRSIVVSEMWNLEIHPQIYERCWHLYNTRKYDDAILNATKALEVAVRTKAKLPESCVGIDVINTAFSLKKPLLRYSKIEAEQEGMMSLLRGVIQVFKNPQSHRFVGVQSKTECLSVLLMCSNLLYVIDNAEYVGVDVTTQ
jgi:uncharacterized protein (TIGR02391 family)